MMQKKETARCGFYLENDENNSTITNVEVLRSESVMRSLTKTIRKMQKKCMVHTYKRAGIEKRLMWEYIRQEIQRKRYTEVCGKLKQLDN